MRRVILAFFAFVALYLGAVFVGQRSLLFPRPGLARAPARPADATSSWLATSAGRVETWYLPPKTESDPAPLLIYFHGNGEVIDYLPAYFDEPRSWGMAVMLVEYPGYGRSEGAPSEASITSAALAAFDWAARQKHIDASRIVAHGRSLGGAAATIVAAKRPVAALVLESTFTSVRSFAHRFLVPEFFVRDPFDSLSLLRTYAGPTLLFHGDRDEVIPFEHGEALARAARRGRFHRLGCGHNDCPAQWAVIRGFLLEHSILRP